MDSIAELGRKIIGERAEIEHRSAVLGTALVNANNWLTRGTTVTPNEAVNANTYIDTEAGAVTPQTTAVSHEVQVQAEANANVGSTTETANRQDNMDYLIAARRAVEDAQSEVS